MIVSSTAPPPGQWQTTCHSAPTTSLMKTRSSSCSQSTGCSRPLSPDTGIIILVKVMGCLRYVPTSKSRPPRLLTVRCTSQSVYNPLYSTINSAMNTGGHAANSAGQSLRATQSPPPRPQFPKLEPVHLPEATTVQDFVSMNESFIATDLPENSPFAHARTEEKEKSDSLFPGYPYPENHHWHQTFKITEIKQIGPKKQRLACFFCRSRKIACATRAVDDESQGRPCECVAKYDLRERLLIGEADNARGGGSSANTRRTVSADSTIV